MPVRRLLTGGGEVYAGQKGRGGLGSSHSRNFSFQMPVRRLTGGGEVYAGHKGRGGLRSSHPQEKWSSGDTITLYRSFDRAGIWLVYIYNTF